MNTASPRGRRPGQLNVDAFYRLAQLASNPRRLRPAPDVRSAEPPDLAKAAPDRPMGRRGSRPSPDHHSLERCASAQPGFRRSRSTSWPLNGSLVDQFAIPPTAPEASPASPNRAPRLPMSFSPSCRAGSRHWSPTISSTSRARGHSATWPTSMKAQASAHVPNAFQSCASTAISGSEKAAAAGHTRRRGGHRKGPRMADIGP